LARITTEAVELHGTVIPAGERVVLVVGSANRDERVFERADVYDLDRPERELQQIASFGFGRHFCLGASLARLEAQVCLEELVARVGEYEIDPDGIRRVHSVNVRGFAGLPTTVVPR
jgi:cytochrome P450